jgi:hypothetical protein
VLQLTALSKMMMAVVQTSFNFPNALKILLHTDEGSPFIAAGFLSLWILRPPFRKWVEQPKYTELKNDQRSKRQNSSVFSLTNRVSPESGQTSRWQRDSGTAEVKSTQRGNFHQGV